MFIVQFQQLFVESLFRVIFIASHFNRLVLNTKSTDDSCCNFKNVLRLLIIHISFLSQNNPNNFIT